VFSTKTARNSRDLIKSERETESKAGGRNAEERTGGTEEEDNDDADVDKAAATRAEVACGSGGG